MGQAGTSQLPRENANSAQAEREISRRETGNGTQAVRVHRRKTGSDNGKVPTMKNETGVFGLILGGLVAVAAAILILNGGIGNTTVNSDADLPPIASNH